MLEPKEKTTSASCSSSKASASSAKTSVSEAAASTVSCRLHSASTVRGLPVVATAAGGEGEQQGQDGEPPHFGTSTTTLVDFTLAMARTPGSRPSSSAASLLISDTTR